MHLTLSVGSGRMCTTLPFPLLFCPIKLIQEAGALYYLSHNIQMLAVKSLLAKEHSLALTMVIITSLHKPQIAILVLKLFKIVSDLTKSVLINCQNF